MTDPNDKRTENQICPLMSPGAHSYAVGVETWDLMQCERERCAFWDGECARCYVVSVAQAIVMITKRARWIVKGKV